jgi:hypothetical protein
MNIWYETTNDTKKTLRTKTLLLGEIRQIYLIGEGPSEVACHDLTRWFLIRHSAYNPGGYGVNATGCRSRKVGYFRIQKQAAALYFLLSARFSLHKCHSHDIRSQVTWLKWHRSSSFVTNHQQVFLHCATSKSTVKNRNFSWLWCS